MLLDKATANILSRDDSLVSRTILKLHQYMATLPRRLRAARLAEAERVGLVQAVMWLLLKPAHFLTSSGILVLIVHWSGFDASVVLRVARHGHVGNLLVTLVRCCGPGLLLRTAVSLLLHISSQDRHTVRSAFVRTWDESEPRGALGFLFLMATEAIRGSPNSTAVLARPASMNSTAQGSTAVARKARKAQRRAASGTTGEDSTAGGSVADGKEAETCRTPPRGASDEAVADEAAGQRRRRYTLYYTDAEAARIEAMGAEAKVDSYTSATGGEANERTAGEDALGKVTEATLLCGLPSCSLEATRDCACKVQGYCSREHQHDDSQAHKVECRRIQAEAAESRALYRAAACSRILVNIISRPETQDLLNVLDAPEVFRDIASALSAHTDRGTPSRSEGEAASCAAGEGEGRSLQGTWGQNRATTTTGSTASTIGAATASTTAAAAAAAAPLLPSAATPNPSWGQGNTAAEEDEDEDDSPLGGSQLTMICENLLGLLDTAVTLSLWPVAYETIATGPQRWDAIVDLLLERVVPGEVPGWLAEGTANCLWALSYDEVSHDALLRGASHLEAAMRSPLATEGTLQPVLGTLANVLDKDDDGQSRRAFLHNASNIDRLVTFCSEPALSNWEETGTGECALNLLITVSIGAPDHWDRLRDTHFERALEEQTLYEMLMERMVPVLASIVDSREPGLSSAARAGLEALGIVGEDMVQLSVVQMKGERQRRASEERTPVVTSRRKARVQRNFFGARDVGQRAGGGYGRGCDEEGEKDGVWGEESVLGHPKK